MKKADIITGSLLFVAACYITVVAQGMVLWTVGADSAPGPGFVPFVAGLSLLLLSTALIIRALITKETKKVEIFTKERVKPLLLITGSAWIASWLSGVLGIVIAMGLMGGFLTFGFSEKRNWILIACVTAIIPVVLHLIFVIGLAARLPIGIFGI